MDDDGRFEQLFLFYLKFYEACNGGNNYGLFLGEFYRYLDSFLVR